MIEEGIKKTTIEAKEKKGFTLKVYEIIELDKSLWLRYKEGKLDVLSKDFFESWDIEKKEITLKDDSLWVIKCFNWKLD